MRWLRNKKYRIGASLAAGMTAVFLINAVPQKQEFLVPVRKECGQVYGWWGTMYPKFCFSKEKQGKLKISFWLAKAFDW